MEEVRFGTQLQQANRALVHSYAPFLTTAATLTMKQYAKVRVPRFDNYGTETYAYCKKLDDAIIASTIRRFEDRLTHALYGNQAKHRNKAGWAKPLILVTVEGRKTHKREHLHIAVGNVPADKLADIEMHIKRAWKDCEFGDEQVCVKPLFDSFGWLDYITKEVGYTDDDAFAIEYACIPETIQQSICTEGRLL